MSPLTLQLPVSAPTMPHPPPERTAAAPPGSWAAAEDGPVPLPQAQATHPSPTALCGASSLAQCLHGWPRHQRRCRLERLQAGFRQPRLHGDLSAFAHLQSPPCCCYWRDLEQGLLALLMVVLVCPLRLDVRAVSARLPQRASPAARKHTLRDAITAGPQLVRIDFLQQCLEVLI